MIGFPVAQTTGGDLVTVITGDYYLDDDLSGV